MLVGVVSVNGVLLFNNQCGTSSQLSAARNGAECGNRSEDDACHRCKRKMGPITICVRIYTAEIAPTKAYLLNIYLTIEACRKYT